MKANIDKCHFLSNLHIKSEITMKNFSTQNSGSQELLGVTIDRNLNFNEHISKPCEKASMKIAALARTFPYTTLNQRRNLMKTYFMS